MLNSLYAKFSENWRTQTAFFDTNGNPLDSKTAATYYSQRLRLVADQLVENGVKVVIFLDSAQFPNLLAGGRQCEPEWFRPFISEDCFIPKSTFLEERDKNFGWISQWADGSRKFVWDAIDPTTCNETMCLASHYSDSNHFKDYYARYLFSLFIRRFPNLSVHQKVSKFAVGFMALVFLVAVRILVTRLIAVLTRMRYRSIAQVHEFQGFSQSRCTSCVQEPLYAKLLLRDFQSDRTSVV